MCPHKSAFQLKTLLKFLPLFPSFKETQSNSVKVISEGSDSVSPTVSKAIAEWFNDE